MRKWIGLKIVRYSNNRKINTNKSINICILQKINLGNQFLFKSFKPSIILNNTRRSNLPLIENNVLHWWSSSNFCINYEWALVFERLMLLTSDHKTLTPMIWCHYLILIPTSSVSTPINGQGFNGQFVITVSVSPPPIKSGRCCLAEKLLKGINSNNPKFLTLFIYNGLLLSKIMKIFKMKKERLQDLYVINLISI